MNLSALTKSRQTALHLAGKADKDDIVAVLLEKGLNPNAQDDQGNTVLHIAFIEGNLNVVQQLLSEPERINLQIQNAKYVFGKQKKKPCTKV